MLEQYVALDLEMTGLNPKRDQIIEIGAARIKNGVVKETYETFVCPTMKIPGKVTAFTIAPEEMDAPETELMSLSAVEEPALFSVNWSVFTPEN